MPTTAENTEIPSSKARAWLSTAIVLYLLAQLAVPLSYYLGVRDTDDERFAWRMFSTTRIRECAVAAAEVTRSGARARVQPLELERIVHAAWISHLRRGKKRVAERFLEQRCRDSSSERVLLERRCRGVDGDATFQVRATRHCQNGTVTWTQTQ